MTSEVILDFLTMLAFIESFIKISINKCVRKKKGKITETRSTEVFLMRYRRAHVLNKHFWLRFGLANAIDNYLRLKFMFGV